MTASIDFIRFGYRLLIRRSLVRAEVGEPITSIPFYLFLVPVPVCRYLEGGGGLVISFLVTPG
jgi:hypothetical protein